MKLFDFELPKEREVCFSLDEEGKILGPIEKRTATTRFNLAVQITLNCNSCCPFCIAGSNREPVAETWNFKKFEEIMVELQRPELTLSGLSFTGGEPCFEMDRFKDVVELSLPHLSSRTYVNMNTNGTFLRSKKFTEEIAPHMHSINLSRHHWDDKINKSIFIRGGSLERDIRDWSEKKRLILKCNLMKGGIETIDQAKTYLDWAIDLDVLMAGFTGLIDINSFTNRVQVDFQEFIKNLNADSEKFLFLSKTENGSCNCANHYYMGSKGGMIRVWSHHVEDHTGENAMQLVYDGNNLKLGYSGPIIL